MRAISKQGSGGYDLGKAHKNPPLTPGYATSRWRKFKPKSVVMDNLLNEQYYLCCYSEFRPDQEGWGYHIEHVENKSQNPARTFDYSNLAASAFDSHTGLKQQDKTKPEEVFGGHASGKQANVNLSLFVSCHQPDCARFFAYLPSSGEIVPREELEDADKDKARYTIQLLNLNSPLLVTLRRQWGQELQSLLDEHIQKGWSIEHLAQIYLLPTNGKLNRFFSLTRQFYGQAAENVLKQHAPQLV